MLTLKYLEPSEVKIKSLYFKKMCFHQADLKEYMMTERKLIKLLKRLLTITKMESPSLAAKFPMVKSASEKKSVLL